MRPDTCSHSSKAEDGRARLALNRAGLRDFQQAHCEAELFHGTGNGNSHLGRCGHTSLGCLPGSQKKKKKKKGKEREKEGIVESRASAAAHTPRPRLFAVAAAALGPRATPRWLSPRTPRPAGRCPPAGTSGAYPAPAAAAIKSGCFAWNFLVPRA